MIEGYDSKQYPVTEVLRMSDDTLCYEWDEAAIFQHDETGYYAFHSNSGCSCSYFEEDYSEDFFKYELVWHPNISPAVLGMSLWVRELREASQRDSKFDRLQAFVSARP